MKSEICGISFFHFSLFRLFTQICLDVFNSLNKIGHNNMMMVEIINKRVFKNRLSRKIQSYKQIDNRCFQRYPNINENLTPILLNDYIKLVNDLDTDICGDCGCNILFENYMPYCFYQFSFHRLDAKKIHSFDNLQIKCWRCSSYSLNEHEICSRGCHDMEGNCCIEIDDSIEERNIIEMERKNMIKEEEKRIEKERKNMMKEDTKELSERNKLLELYSNRQYIYCRYDEKDECKALGAKWDFIKKQWYIPEGIDNTLFNKWLVKQPQSYPS